MIEIPSWHQGTYQPKCSISTRNLIGCLLIDFSNVDLQSPFNCVEAKFLVDELFWGEVAMFGEISDDCDLLQRRKSPQEVLDVLVQNSRVFGPD